MKDTGKNKFFNIEIFISAFLVLFSIALFDRFLSPAMKLSLVLAVILGFYSSRLSRGLAYLNTIKNLAFLCSAAALIWSIYAVIKSSFFYKEVLLIFANTLFVLSAILSFGAVIPELLGYIQVLSIALFLIACALTKNHDFKFLVPAVGYVFLLLAAVRIKLFSFFSPGPGEKTRYDSYYMPMFLFFFLALFAGWSLYGRFPLGQINTKGFFLDEDYSGGIEQEKKYKEKTENSQEKMQQEVTKWILTLKTTEEKQELLMLLSAFIQDPHDAVTAAEAENGLIYSIKSHAMRLGAKAKGEELARSIQEYSENNLESKVAKVQNDMVDVLKSQTLNILDRAKTMDSLNKMLQSDSYKDIMQNRDNLQKTVNSSHFEEGAKNELKDLASGLSGWKSYQTYRKISDSIAKKAGQLKGGEGDEIENAMKSIDNMRKIEDEAEPVKKAIKALKQKLAPQNKNIADGLEELLNLKSEMNALKSKAALYKKLGEANIAQDKLKGLKNELEGSDNAENSGQAAKTLTELKSRVLGDEVLSKSPEAKELLETKLNKQAKKNKQEMENKIKGANLGETGEKLLSDLDGLASAQDRESLNSAAKQMGESIDRLNRAGLISKEQKDNFSQQLGSLSSLLSASLESREQSQQGTISSDSQLPDYRSEILKIMRGKPSMGAMNKLMGNLSNADTISRIEDIRQAMKEEVRSSSNQTSKLEAKALDSFIDKMCEAGKSMLIEKSNLDIRSDLDELAKAKPLKALALKKQLRELKDAKTEQELKKKLENMEAQVDAAADTDLPFASGEGVSKKMQRNVTGKPVFLKLHVLPAISVLQLNSAVALKCVAVFNSSLIKDLSQDLEWVSSNPAVVAVDSKGIAYGLAKGSAEVFALYNGTASQRSEITVVDALQKNISEELKNALGE
ncbi:MAG: hypothetical protein PHN57_00520 [Candidatus Omnitrophica bacterium]|nr:hypothetical protein [Candidatus Omnitrophota bacterium]